MADGETPKVPVLECVYCRKPISRTVSGTHYVHKETREEACDEQFATPNYDKFDRERAESRQRAIEARNSRLE